MPSTPEAAGRAATPGTPASGAYHSYADALRVIASCAVVMIHVQVRVLENDASAPTRAASLFYLVASAWAVPVFFALSGALLLRRTTADEPASAFFRKRFRRLLVPVAFWTLVFWALSYRSSRGKTSLGAWAAERGDALLRGEPNFHLWFAFALLGLYAITPALRVARRLATPSQFRSVAGLALLITLLSALADAFRPYLPGGVASQSNAFVKWLPYVGYFLLGPILADRAVGRRDARAGAILFVACTALGYAGSLAGTQLGQAWERLVATLFQSSASPTVLGQAVAVFITTKALLATRDATAAGPGVLSRFGELTLAVYLLHPLAIGTGYRLATRLSGGHGGPWVLIPMTCVGAVALSFAAAFVLRAWRPARSIVG